MAREPLHLVNIKKNCPCCNSAVVKFVYFNNYQITQPRYKCKRCRQFFTYGGQCRAARVVNSSPTSTTSTPVVATADRRTGPARRGRPRRSERVTPNSGAREIHQETPATCARTEARTVATCARSTEARTRAARSMAARPSTGALRLRRIPISEQPESPVPSPVPSPVVSAVVSAVEIPAVPGPVPTASIAKLVPGEVVDVDQRPASGTAATVIVPGGDVMESTWTKAILGISPYDLAPASNGKRMRLMRIKCDGKESVVPFWA